MFLLHRIVFKAANFLQNYENKKSRKCTFEVLCGLFFETNSKLRFATLTRDGSAAKLPFAQRCP